MSRRVFDVMRSECLGDALPPETEIAGENIVNGLPDSNGTQADNPIGLQGNEDNNNVPFQLYKRRTTIVVKRDAFLDIVCDALSLYKYVGPNQRADLELACR